MKPRDAIAWFKTTFGDTLEEAVAGTPFSVDMLAAIAYQETGYIWSVLVDALMKTAPGVLEQGAAVQGQTDAETREKMFRRAVLV